MKHLVVYFYKKGTDIGVGSVDGYFPHNPPTMTDIQNAQKEIQEKFSMDRAIVLNCFSLSEEDAEDKEGGMENGESL